MDPFYSHFSHKGKIYNNCCQTVLTKIRLLLWSSLIYVYTVCMFSFQIFGENTVSLDKKIRNGGKNNNLIVATVRKTFDGI